MLKLLFCERRCQENEKTYHRQVENISKNISDNDYYPRSANKLARRKQTTKFKNGQRPERHTESNIYRCQMTIWNDAPYISHPECTH